MAESSTMQQQSAPKNTSGKSVWIEQPVPHQMSRTYFYQDGTTVTKKNGTVSWRNNNEGNLRPGSLSSTRIGVDQRNFAVFATPEDGRAAKKYLLFSSSSYKDLTLKKAIARYAPSSDNNNPTSYANFVMKNGNVADKVMSTYTADEQERILQAMKRQEGYKEGETIKGTANNAALKNVIAQSASNNAVASAKPAEKSGAAAQGGRQMNAEGHPIYYPKGAKETQDIINWNKGRNYTADYIKSFQKVIGTKVDGGIGTDTVNAIRHYQEKNGLGQDGKWGKDCADHAKLERKYNSGSAGNTTNASGGGGTIGTGGIHYLTTKQVAKADTGRKTKKIVDLLTKKAFNVSWDSAPGYHSDCTPMTTADTTVFKSIRDPSKSPNDPSWTNTRSWGWEARPAAIQLKDGRWVACGYHQRPHAAIMGGSPGSPFKNKSNTKPKGGWPLGGHFCVYYGDSPGGTKKCNDAARRAKNMSL